ncbi:MAG: DUF3048 domain-containing protein [Clostridia bacterium]|nr:DUF3048 domain-containing protein [Clostridia bacterium]
MKNKKVIMILVAIAVIVILAVVLAFKVKGNKKAEVEEPAAPENVAEENIVEEPAKEEIKIYNGNDRPIAVMIDNHKGAWPQAGLNKAYMVYEIIVEGGETRLMPVFKGVNLSEIGPVRSSRHYFLDYAMENDAIYTHYGWSPQAKSDIDKYSVNNINGINYSKSQFWRVTTKKSPHNVLTSTSSILSIAKDKGYKTTSSAESVLNYVAKEVDLTDGTDANNVTIPYSTLHTVKYTYNKNTKKYERYARGSLQKDYTTKEVVSTKNIIIEFVENSSLNDGSGKGRQTIDNIGTFDGYYITNGKAIKIKCTKSARNAKTVYRDLSGNVIEVNDGNTWMNICPKDAKVEIK